VSTLTNSNSSSKEELLELPVAERQDRIAIMYMDGYSAAEISRQLGIDRKTVRRDLAAWRETEHANFIWSEWMELYQKMKKRNIPIALKTLTAIITKIDVVNIKEVTVQNNNLTVETADIVNDIINFSRNREQQRNHLNSQPLQ